MEEKAQGSPSINPVHLERAYGQEFMRMMLDKALLLQQINTITEEAYVWKARAESAEEKLEHINGGAR